ncbi:MAG: leucine-rich repeat protein, partial [Clostridia bacterium]|nr:leucine-rich repeat protein [Clostridia bacterium]
PRIALISRGDNTFKEKVEIAMQMGAIGVIIYNNVAGKIRMSLGEIEDPCPAVSVNLEAGTSLVLGAGDTADKSRYIGEITIDTSLSAGPFMSDFSSWGPTPDLKLKPEITAHGGEITSAVPGGYDEQSGTSMASPNMAGAMAIIRQYVKEEFNLGDSIADRREITRLCNQLAMSNTTIAYDPEGLPYSPRKQGSGLANLSNIIKSNAYITVEGTDKTKLEFGDDKNRTGEYKFEFTVVNKGKEALSFNPTSIVMTETLSIDGLAVAEKAHLFEDCTTTYTVNGAAHSGAISINAGASAVIGAKIVLTEEEKKYIDDRFENGMYVEGFFKLVSADAEKQNDISVPFLAFYGDWTDGNLLDYSVYELAEIEKDTSKTEEEKEKESVFATSPYTSYHDDYILPMGTFIYALPDDADPVYAEEKFAAVSGYNLYYGEDENGNYRTTWELRMLYAGLLRNAKRVDYTLTNMDTGELLLEESAHRVSKAHSGGGSTRPGFVELEIDPKEYGFRNNTQYQMSFDFDFEYVDVSGEKTVESDNFTYSFYADYDAPVLTDSSVRYYYYKDGKTTKRKVFLDLDVYDNHYAQSVLLCYTDEEDNYLKLVNDYVTPVRQKNINGTTTVSIEITDIYDRFDGELFVQLDDYAMNYKVYGLNFDDMKQKRMPAELSVDPAEENVTVAINEMKKVTPVYTSPADIADFVWTSADESIAIVKNGEIVGVAPGETTVTVSTVVPVDEEGNPTAEPLTATYNVKVTDSRIELSYPAMNFGIIRNSKDSYVKAEGLVEVHPNEQFQLKLEYDPWYYPTENLTIEWSTSNDKVATIDQEGNVHTLKKGTAIINAVIKGTSYSTGVTLKVGEEFIVNNYRLVDYHGTGGKVYIPTDMNIFYIETDAFKNNDNITEIVINKTVMEIREQAFRGCTALKRVSFVESEPMDVADADLNMIFDEAFINCTALEEVDFSNTKTILVGRRVFKNCTSLNSLGVDKNGVSGATKLGTVSAEAFEGCTSLEEIDITRFNMSGKNVFKGCTSLKTVKTADFTSIGNGMFEGCTALESIEINTAKVGANAFEGCENLASVTFNANGLNLGASAFEGCESLASVTLNGTVNSIGDRAFAGTALTEAVIPAGLTSIGERLFDGASITKAVIKKGVDIESIYALGSPFAGLTLSEIAVEDNEKYATVDGVVYNSSKTEIILVPNGIASFNVPETVTSIAANAFYGNMNVVGVSKNGITFKSGAVEEFTVSSIGAYAFAACTVETADLTNVIFGDGAFSECLALTTVTVNCAVIPAHAFERTEALTTLNTTSDLVQICDYAFANTALKSIDLSAAIVDDSAFAFSKVESVVLKNATTVGISAFEGSAVKSVELGAVSYMGSRAFANCNSLATVTLAEGSTMIADSAFYKEEESKVLTTVNVPETLTFVGAYAFYNNAGLKSFVAEGLTYVGNFAFTYANALKNFAFDNVTYVGDYAFTGARVDVSKDLFEREFSWMAADIEYAADFTKLNLAKVTHIGQYAFAGVPATEIKAPVVEHIGEQAFYATEMATFNVPATVEFIGEGAFAATFNATEFTSDNATYVSEEGVIYRIMDNGKLELFAYPAARKAERDPNMMSYRYYTVKEGTVRIAEYAGSFIQAGAMHEIVFPYTLKTIGSYAFFNSAIETYT